MTKEEFGMIVKGMKAVYSEPTFIPDNYAMEVWYSMLKDLDYQAVSKATQKFMMQSSKTPRPADIREMVASFIKGAEFNELPEMEAWSLVSKALRNGTYGSEAEFEKLPPVVQKAVGSPHQLYTWATDEDYNESVVSSNFMRSYRICLERQKEEAKIPDYIKGFFVTGEDVKKIEDKE